MRRVLVMTATAALLFVVLGATGCQLAAIFGDRTKPVRAEYPYLSGKKVCLIVRADPETQQMYPHVQFELADFVRVELESKIRNLQVVDPRKVVDFQRSDASWETMDPAALGKRFGADRIIELDLTQYTTREPENEYLYRGHITAAVRVYNAEYPNSQPTYKTEVAIAYPPEGAHWTLDERTIRQAAMELFAQTVTGKFYDHRES